MDVIQQKSKSCQDLEENNSKSIWNIFVLPVINFIDKSYLKNVLRNKTLHFADNIEAVFINGFTD